VADSGVAHGDNATRRPVGRPRKQDTMTRGPDGKFCKQDSSSNFNVSRPGNTTSTMYQQSSSQGEAEASVPRTLDISVRPRRQRNQTTMYDAASGQAASPKPVPKEI
jgi:hypothetical protein